MLARARTQAQAQASSAALSNAELHRSARHYPDTHGMAGCFCNHPKDPNATISWTLVSAEVAPLHALVPTIVSLRRTGAGEFVMLDCGVRYTMDAAHC